MDIKISLTINVDADSENDAKNAIINWILENIPSVLPEENILINSIDSD